MKKILFTVTLSLVLSFLCFSKQTVYAVNENPSSLGKFQQELQDAVDTGEPSLSSWVGGSESVDPEKGKTGMVPAIINSFATLFFPVVVEDPLQLGTYKIKSGGAIIAAAGILPAFYTNPPASSIEYFADLGRRLNITSPVYAQGVGFTALTPYLKLWKAFRNLSYLILIIISITLGLMIMFRVKLSPQAIISVQSSIPKIVTALILITFSYAIAGLFIDIMYLLIGIFLQSLSAFGAIPASEVATMRQDYLSLDLIGSISLLSGKGITVLWEVTTKTALGQAIVKTALGGLFLKLALLIGGTAVTGGWGGVLAGLIGGVGSITTGLAMAGASLFILGLGVIIFGLILQTILMFVKAYISLLFSIILSPLIILFSALPSARGGDGMGSWIKSILQPVLVFVLGVIVLVLGQLLMSTPSNWGPPFIGSSSQIIQIAIGLGILTVLPHLEEMVKAFLESKGLQLAISTREFESFSRNIEGMVTDSRKRPAVLQEGWNKLAGSRNEKTGKFEPGAIQELIDQLKSLRR